jgi:hypothetical protein
MEKKTMSDLIQLTDAEIAGVSGGTYQSIYIDASQSNSSSVSQTSTASNTGAVSATANGNGSTAAAAGAESSNLALVLQLNNISARNSVRSGHH